jgi:RND family efflux transporter MFP subunit
MTMPQRSHRDSHAKLVGETDSHPAGDLGFPLPGPAKISRTRALAFGAATVGVLGAIFFASYLPVHRSQRALAAAAEGQGKKVQRVEVTAPARASSNRSLSLPGTIRALEETIVYPRASGYVRKWHADLGDKVKEGDLLAEIDTPEVDQQIAQARAQLSQAEAGLALTKANANFSQQNFQRYEKLAPKGIASQEEFEKTRAQADVDIANVTVAQANVEAQRANLQRLAQMKSFARVTAPFGGKIVERNIGRGALVTAGNASPLFRIAAVDPARVFVQVPQDVAPSVTPGSQAIVKVREFAGRAFQGELVRSAGALDATTRTMTIEVHVPNPKGELLAGMYAEVALSLPTPHTIFVLPATALFNDAQGLRVAVVDAENRVHLRPIVIERDTGATVEIASGLDGSEKIVKLAHVELAEGTQVEVAR